MPNLKTNVVYMVVDNATTFDYYTYHTDGTTIGGTVRWHHSSKRARQYAGPDAPIERLAREDWTALTVPDRKPEPEDEVKYMIECAGCGEVFDDIQAAAKHEGKDDSDVPCMQYTSTGMLRSSTCFSLIREDEAF